MKEVIEHLERMAETLDGVDEENWIDTPQDIAQIYRSVANEIKQKMSAQNQSVTNCNQLKNVPTCDKSSQVGNATPLRNCDVYTMEEQSKRHEEYCKAHTTNERCVKCPLWQMRLLGINCAIAWANFPYEKEGDK